MNMKIKAMILLLVFCGILYLPFAVHAGSGNIFSGVPVPDLGGGTASADTSSAPEEDNAAIEEYAQTLPKPELSSACAQYTDGQQPAAVPSGTQFGISFEDMRNHMNYLKEAEHSTNDCLGCHTNRQEFCDRCHNYVGVDPAFD